MDLLSIVNIRMGIRLHFILRLECQSSLPYPDKSCRPSYRDVAFCRVPHPCGFCKAGDFDQVAAEFLFGKELKPSPLTAAQHTVRTAVRIPLQNQHRMGSETTETRPT